MSKSLKMPELYPKVSKGDRRGGGLMGGFAAKGDRGRRKGRVRVEGGKSSRRVGRG